MRKTILGLTLMAATLWSCQVDGPGTATPSGQITIDFEQMATSDNGYGTGSDSGTNDPTNTYDILTAQQNGATFSTWTDATSGFWWGWAFSRNVGSEYLEGYLHQYNCPLPPVSGNIFAVCYFSDYSKDQYVPTIRFDHAAAPQSVKLTNSTTVECYTSGTDAYSQWDDTDKLAVVISGHKGNAQTGEVEVTLAEGKERITTWCTIDLTPLGTVDRIEFRFTTTDVGEWGINAPTYVCIDDLKYQIR